MMELGAESNRIVQGCEVNSNSKWGDGNPLGWRLRAAPQGGRRKPLCKGGDPSSFLIQELPLLVHQNKLSNTFP